LFRRASGFRYPTVELRLQLPVTAETTLFSPATN
jgi:hypothetical protein